MRNCISNRRPYKIMIKCQFIFDQYDCTIGSSYSYFDWSASILSMPILRYANTVELPNL